MLRNYLRRIIIVEDDLWFSERDLEIYSGLIDTALYTEDKCKRIESLAHIRRMAFDYIEKDNPLGYRLMGDWNSLQGKSDNALVNYQRAANAGVPHAAKKIDDYKLYADSYAGSCILLAEAYFLNGNEQDGIRYLKKSIDLGCRGSEGVLRLHEKRPGGKMTSFSDISLFINEFRLRQSESIFIDYSNVDTRYKEKTINFCRGFAIATGVVTTVCREKQTVCISHSYMERVLVKSAYETKPDKVILIVRERGDLEAAIRFLMDGVAAIIRYSECRTELAKEIFDTLNGLTFGLGGEINRKTDNVYEYVPHFKEADGTEFEVWKYPRLQCTKS